MATIESVSLSMRFASNPKLRKKVASLSAYRCSFPGCDQELMINGTFIGEIAAIEALSGSGPRHNNEADPSTLVSPDNYLLLCPNHHRVIDHQPEKYTVTWLREARAKHLDRIMAMLVANQPQTEIKLASSIEVSLKDSIAIWNSSKENESEEFWQDLFERCPAAIAQLFPRSMLQIGKKCYVGGKELNNSGGNLVDFVYASKSTNNVVLVEIKTPKTKLLGKHYRGNAYAISEDISGSIVQVLNYKDSLIKEYYSLSKSEIGSPFSAFSPKCVVIAGTTEADLDNPTKMKSFELFRNEVSGVDLVTYDELFEKIQCVLDIAL